MFDFKQLQALAQVIEEQSFEKAALKLHITQSAVSQRIKQLEETLGQVLIVRSHPISATAAGITLLKHYRQIEMLHTAVVDELDTKHASGHTQLSIGVNADTLATWFLSALEPIIQKHKVLLDLKVDDQDETHKLLKNGEVMGCISSKSESLQGCNTLHLGQSVYRCLASPDFIETYFPQGPDSDSLKQAPIAEFNYKDALQKSYLKRFFNLEANEYLSHRIPSSHAFIEILQKGIATGMVPDEQSAELLQSGVLLDIAPGKFISVPLYWHVWSLKTPLEYDITQALVATARKNLQQTG